MDMLTIVALLMILLVILSGFQKRVPMFLALIFIPLVAALILGHSISEVSSSMIGLMNTTMGSGGYLLIFAMIYFAMLTESGMFATIINSLSKRLDNRMNVFGLMIFTTAMTLLCGLTAQITVTYLVLFPILLPLYKKYNFNRNYGYVITMTAMSIMMILPWSAGAINVSVVLGCTPEELASAGSRMALCIIPGIIFQWCYYAYRYKKEFGSFKLVVNEGVAQTAQSKDNGLKLPQLFWPNLIVLVALIVAMIAFRFPTYLAFAIGSAYMIIFNYPKLFFTKA